MVEAFMILFVLFGVGFLLFGYIPLKVGNKHKKWSGLILITSFLLSAVLFYLISVMTFEPTTISGNGNPAILVMPFAIASYMGSLFLLYKTDLLHKGNPRFFLIGSIVGVIVLVAGEVVFVQKLIEALGGGPEVPESRIFRFGWFNQYTNTLYFNGYTFGIGILIVLAIRAVLKRK